MQTQAVSERGTTNRKTTAHTNKYLTFELAGETYGIGILKIREIIKVMEITPLPHASDSVKGVINLRGKIIPVVDLRMRFGVAASEFTDRTCIVVVDLENEEGVRKLVGATVDAVSEVSQIPGRGHRAAAGTWGGGVGRLHPWDGQDEGQGRDPAGHRQAPGGRARGDLLGDVGGESAGKKRPGRPICPMEYSKACMSDLKMKEGLR